jgi:hypothetical protein
MAQQIYSIERNDEGKWVISADGQQILLCMSKSVAFDTVKAAAKLLLKQAT